MSEERQPLYRADPERVLRILAESQFEDPFLAFRELYANALDAVRGRLDARIILQVSADRVVVEDDGQGLDDVGLSALTTLGVSTRRGTDAIGRFGMGFASIFDPSLGVDHVRFIARRPAPERALELRFTPDAGGGVAIARLPAAVPRLGGSRVEVWFDPDRAPPDRRVRIHEILTTHAAYSGVETELDGRRLGRTFADYVEEVTRAEVGSAERSIAHASAVEGPVGVAAIDPARAESKLRAYQRGLFVCEITLPKPRGEPWPRGVFGAVSAEGLELVASRNAFVENDRYRRFLEELRSLALEAAYRLVQHFEVSGDAYTRVVLLDALRRGLRGAAPEVLVAEADDLFAKALVRSPMFEAWGTGRKYAFEELVALDQQGRFRALSYRPALADLEAGPILRAEDSVERDIFRKLSGLRDMPAAARGEEVAKPGMWSRFADRFLSGPRSEYSLFRREVRPHDVDPRTRAVIEALEALLQAPEIRRAVGRLVPGALPRLGFGASRNAFGPIAAFRGSEIRFNVRHRTLRKLARHPDAARAARGLLPVLAHELAHMCHELHDLDFYRTSRTLLRALVSAVAAHDADALAAKKDSSSTWAEQ
ncbi:MAG: ATP-binding protein [Myxococcota bacterium]